MNDGVPLWLGTSPESNWKDNTEINRETVVIDHMMFRKLE